MVVGKQEQGRAKTYLELLRREGVIAVLVWMHLPRLQ